MLKWINILFAILFAVGAADKLWLFYQASKRRGRVVAPEDEEFASVAVQLPMFNEYSVFERAIDCACGLEWPKRALCIQVLDDSTDFEIRRLIDTKIQIMRSRGYNIAVHRRVGRAGFKAGSLQQGLAYLDGFPYVAIFDADFEPTHDFLRRAIPVLAANPNAGFVQARWTYTNPGSSFLTKLQKLSLDFHFFAEQKGRSQLSSFMNFNGSGGVWRSEVIRDAGGWSGETLVEDADLSLRAYLRGFRGVFLSDLECLNQLPETDRAYRTQQRRWLAGPMHLARLNLSLILSRRDVSPQEKLALYWFFLRYGYFVIAAAYSLLALPTLLALGGAWTQSFAAFALFTMIPVIANPPLWTTGLVSIFGCDYTYFKARCAIEGILGMEGARIWTVTERGRARDSARKIHVEEAVIASLFAASIPAGIFMHNYHFMIYCLMVACSYAFLALSLSDKLCCERANEPIARRGPHADREANR